MARKKKAPSQPVEAPSFADFSDIDAAFDEAMQGAAQKAGPGLYFTSPHVVNVGIPLPAICLRYLLKSTVFPIGRFSQLAGEEGAGKSMFLTEIIRWVLHRGGRGLLAENEYKEYPQLRNSIFWWDSSLIDRLKVTQTTNVQEWQGAFTHAMTHVRKLMDQHGKTFPFILALDSLNGTLTQDELLAIQTEGYASKSYPAGAQIITRYIRSLGHQFRGYPFLMVATNHLRQQMPQPGVYSPGGPQWQSGGGKSAKYNETYEIWLKKIKDIKLRTHEGLRVHFKVHKSSFGPSRDEITAEVLWWNETPADGGPPLQRTLWDWDTATIEMILGFANTDGKKTLYAELLDLLKLENIDSSARKATSRLIMGTKEKCEFRQIARQLEQTPQLRDEVHRMLDIRTDVELQVNQDYGIYLQEAMQRTVQEQSAAMAQAQAAALQSPYRETQTFVGATQIEQPHDAAGQPEISGATAPEETDEVL